MTRDLAGAPNERTAWPEGGRGACTSLTRWIDRDKAAAGCRAPRPTRYHLDHVGRLSAWAKAARVGQNPPRSREAWGALRRPAASDMAGGLAATSLNSSLHAANHDHGRFAERNRNGAGISSRPSLNLVTRDKTVKEKPMASRSQAGPQIK